MEAESISKPTDTTQLYEHRNFSRPFGFLYDMIIFYGANKAEQIGRRKKDNELKCIRK